MRKWATLVGLAALAGGVGAQALRAAAGPAATLRVGLWTLWHDNEVTVSPAQAGEATARLCEGCAVVALTQSTEIRAGSKGLVLAGKRKTKAVWLEGAVVITAHGESVTLRNPVRIAARKGELTIAVTLPVEDYVERVVASESGTGDSGESLKALAVVVRSFALHVKHGHAEYDVCDSTHCQLIHWGGGGWRRAAHAATLATGGETLWFQGRRAEAWFGQNCGGRTAAPEEVWTGVLNSGQMPWLVSRADPYCTAGGAREWSASLSLADLTTALAGASLVRPGWKTLTVARRGQSGRAVTLMVGDTEVRAEDFRLAVGRALGWGKVLSNWFEVARRDSAQGETFVFHGRGSGHAVGLCQAGAAAMAVQGRDAAQILAQYFAGAGVADEMTGMPWEMVRGQRFALETLTAKDAGFLPQMNQALAEAEERSGLRAAGTFTVRSFRSTEAFREGTLAPGWVAAFTEGNWVGTQPLATLRARKLLGPVLRHEFLHVLVEGQAGANAPLWLREGLVEVWADGGASRRTAPALKLDQAEAWLAHAGTEAESEAAHEAAGWYAGRLLERYGRAQVMGWLKDGVPAQAEAAIR